MARKLLRADPPRSSGVARSMEVAACDAWLSGTSSSGAAPCSSSALDAVIVESELARRRRGAGAYAACCAAYCGAPGPGASEKGGGRACVGGGSRIAARLCGGVRSGAAERMLAGRVGVEGREESDCVPRVWPRGLSGLREGVEGWVAVSWESTLSARRIASRPGFSRLEE